ncbi:hypothetical protein GH714_042066 [Hevea brasiliensis]|uniref:Uncharacterized protein n=1 Tax=Hevea brasiliensis TaxID=3981 RepID=A0A6A6MVZ9_HEVBR|nr:hypothetical protein GH714_042066 [Hevea brasiliensis]
MDFCLLVLRTGILQHGTPRVAKLHTALTMRIPARVKGIFVLARNDGAADDTYLLVSASSDGVIRVWDVRMAVKEKPSPLAEFNTKSRLTCLAGTSLKSLKRPQMANSVPKEKRNIAMEGSPD